MLGFPQARYMPCSECGASVASFDLGGHVCERERWLDYQLFGLRDELARFEADLGAYLATPAGRFELWYAERTRGTESGCRLDTNDHCADPAPRHRSRP
jgi:hypothetical protein